MAAGTPDDPDARTDPAAEAARRIAATEWQLDAEPAFEHADAGTAEAPEPADAGPTPPSPVEPPPTPPSPPPAARRAKLWASRLEDTDEQPPPPERIVEAMLFVGGPPLTPAAAEAAVRGLTADRFRDAVDAINRRYKAQNRPYHVLPKDDGYVMAVRPAFRGLRERLFGGPREARLSQPALDVLSVVAYRQPVGKAEVDALRGSDSGGPLRQLVRLGLVAVAHRADAASREVRYGTTPRFLQLFGLTSLDELPRLGDTGPAEPRV